MIDIRPVGYVIGLLVVALGAAMLLPMVYDIAALNGHWPAFMFSAVLTMLTGGFTALACANASTPRLTIQQTFLLTTGVWLTLPIFGAIPFILGDTGVNELRTVDAFFEAMSGLTTTGATVLSDLEELPEGLLIWRSMLQWFGGIGIIVVAMVFLPELRIGGMQIFRSEGFDTMGKILPRATEIAGRISAVYCVLTLTCALSYLGAGMPTFDAVNHALTTVATGGFSTRDMSMGDFKGAPEYVAVVFMILASLPFVRYVQLLGGSLTPMLNDAQVRGFLWVAGVSIVLVFLYRLALAPGGLEETFRETLFNVTSIATGTGYASANYWLWGGFPVVVIFFIGLVGGCAGSTCCSVKIFRYQILFATVKSQIREIHSPHGVFTARYDGRSVPEDVINSVMAFFVLFTVSLGVIAVLLVATGLDIVTAISGAVAALANIGPGLGDQIGPDGNYAGLNDVAKWILSAAMLIGRLELMVVYALLTVHFWRTS